MNSKIILLACCVLAAVSCTKKKFDTDLYSKSDSPIVFESPLVAPATKASGNVTFDYDHFIVTGVYGNSNLNSFDTSEGHLYMDEVEVTKTTKTIESVDYTTWVAADYLWPKVGKLSFVGYYPKSFKEQLSIGATGVTSGDNYLNFATDNGTVDFLYSERVENVSKYADPSDEKIHTSPTNQYGVQIIFHHALSKIDFTAHLSKELPAGSTVKINSITLANLYYKGKFVQNLGATFADTDGTPSWTVELNDGAEPPVPTVTTYSRNITSPTTITGVGLVNAQNLLLGNPWYVLPQDFADNATININYTIKFAGSAVEEIVNATPVLLNSLNYTYKEDTSDAGAKFLQGKRYTYHIELGFEPIYFSPEVVDWVDVDVNTAEFKL